MEKCLSIQIQYYRINWQNYRMPHLYHLLDQLADQWKITPSRAYGPYPSTQKVTEQIGEAAEQVNSNLTPTTDLTGTIHSPYKLTKRDLYENLSDEDLQRLVRYQNLLVEMINASVFEEISPNDRSPLTSESAQRLESLPRSISTETSTRSGNINNTVEQKLQDFIRMDRGLPLLSKEPLKAKFELTRQPPRILPRMNKAQFMRCEFVRRAMRVNNVSSTVNLAYTTKSPLKPIRDVNGAIKFNKLFELRYHYNRGRPVMPASSKKFYWNHKKLPFKIVRRVHLPKRYLLPTVPKDRITYYGIILDQQKTIPKFRSHQKVEEEMNVSEKPAWQKTRPPLRKTTYRPPKRKQLLVKSSRKHRS